MMHFRDPTDKKSSGRQSLTRTVDSFSSTPLSDADSSYVIPSGPRIVCPDNTPHFLLVPAVNPQIVFIDTISSTQKVANWELWDQPALRSGHFRPTSKDLPYSVETVPGGKHLGVVATRLIKAGELVVSEKPTFVLNLLKLDEKYLDDGPMQLSALSLLAPERRDGYMSLYNCFEKEHPPPSGILRTNYLPVDITPTPDVGDACGVKGIFELLCRANHSCSPNVNYFFDFATFSGQFWAVRDIQPGEEICIQYLWLLRTREKRREVGEEYFRFTCQCRICSRSHAESEQGDARRLFIDSLMPDIETPSLANDKLNEDVTIQQLEDAVKYAEEEELFVFIGRIRIAGAKLLIEQQSWVEAGAWARLAKDAFVRSQGPSSYNVKACEGLLEDIRAHTK
jgi:hypothetical protein